MGVISDFAQHVRNHSFKQNCRVSKSSNDMQALFSMLDEISAYVPIEVGKQLRRDEPLKVVSVPRYSATFIGEVSKSEIHEVCRVADLLFSYFNTEPLSRPRIFYAPVMGAKAVVDPMRDLSCDEVNSGVTYSNAASPNDKIILLFRRQEAIKVLMHELLHALNKDILRSKDARASAELTTRIALTSSVPVLLNETYTETLASFLYSTLLCHGDPSATRKAHADMKRHFLAQAEKLMCIYYSKGRGMSQRTHVFEYYIAKAALFATRTPRQVSLLLDRGDADEILQTLVSSSVDYVNRHVCDLSFFLPRQSKNSLS